MLNRRPVLYYLVVICGLLIYFCLNKYESEIIEYFNKEKTENKTLETKRFLATGSCRDTRGNITYLNGIEVTQVSEDEKSKIFVVKDSLEYILCPKEIDLKESLITYSINATLELIRDNELKGKEIVVTGLCYMDKNPVKIFKENLVVLHDEFVMSDFKLYMKVMNTETGSELLCDQKVINIEIPEAKDPLVVRDNDSSVVFSGQCNMYDNNGLLDLSSTYSLSAVKMNVIERDDEKRTLKGISLIDGKNSYLKCEEVVYE